MKLLTALLLASVCVSMVSHAQEAVDTPATPIPANKEYVRIYTSKGTIEAELWPETAPITVSNILSYVDQKFYDGLIFHRVIPNFMIQGGGFTADMKQKQPGRPIKNEASRDALNKRGTLAMARTMVIDSATSQFFINHKDNVFLDHKDKTVLGFGYCAFGKVIDGMDVVDAIAKVKTTRIGPHADVPAEPVVINTIRRMPAPAE